MSENLPRPDETARAYTERLNAERGSSYSGLEAYFGFSGRAAKGMWVASEEFNARFAYEQWSERMKRSVDGYGPRNWLQKKYKLNEQELDKVVRLFEAGDSRGLLSVLHFEALAQRCVSDSVLDEMKESGAFK